MKCFYVDERSVLFDLLNNKLGGDIVLLPAPEDMQGMDCNVLIARLPDLQDPEFQSSLSRLQKLVQGAGDIPVVAFLGTPNRQVMRIAISAGAYDYFVESSSLDELRIVMRRAAQYSELRRDLARLQRPPKPSGGVSGFVGSDPKMTSVFWFASRVAGTDVTVLITGETGTGKELLAQAIHRSSGRAQHPFVAVACSSLPETLIESELFGHERGAFTGANSSRRGRFEAAENGTLFLDEVGDLSPGLQVKLLRVLQERTFERLGSNQPRPLEARVVCATNRDLAHMVEEGSFRRDLYYRLNTVELELPPLRERRDDIALLAYSFLEFYAQQYGRLVRKIHPALLSVLQEHSWPGNVRELQHMIERAVVICDGDELGLQHLPARFPCRDVNGCGNVNGEASGVFEEEVRNFKRRLIQRSLMAAGNNKLQAARSLGIARSSLHRLIEELHVPAVPGDRGIVH